MSGHRLLSLGTNGGNRGHDGSYAGENGRRSSAILANRPLFIVPRIDGSSGSLLGNQPTELRSVGDPAPEAVPPQSAGMRTEVPKASHRPPEPAGVRRYLGRDCRRDQIGEHRDGLRIGERRKLNRMGCTSIVETWGTSQHERTAVLPCDDLIERPDGILYRGVDVTAPPGVVFRWLCQLRAAPYSYDWVDNLGRRSPRKLVPGLDELEVGQRFMTIFRLASFEDGRSITVDSSTMAFGRVAVTYAVTSAEARRCRLVAKVVFQTRRSLIGRALRPLLPAGDLIMMRKQLLTLKALSERDAGSVAS